MARLSARERRRLKKSRFAVPSKAPGSGTPAGMAAVHAKVHAKYPDMGMKNEAEKSRRRRRMRR